MQELRLQLDGKHEGDCKKPGETSKPGQRKIMPLVCKRVCGRETITHMVTYQSLNESLFYLEQIGFCFKSVPASILKLWLFSIKGYDTIAYEISNHHDFSLDF